MSDLHLKNVLSIDPKTNVEETWRQKEVIMKGGIQKSRYVIAADSFSATNMQWNSITPPSLKTVVERALRVKYTIQIVCTYDQATALNVRPIFPAIGGVTQDSAVNTRIAMDINQPINGEVYTACLRNFPLQSCAVSTEVKINGTSTSVNSSEFINNFSLLMTDKEINRYVEFPAQSDSSARYTANDSNRSPFAFHDQNPAVNSRGSFLGVLVSSVTGGGNCVDTYNFEVVEQLIVSPFTYGDGIDSAVGLSNIDNISININLDNIYRCLSVMEANLPAAVGGATVSVIPSFGTVRPELLVEFITPDPVLAERMPPQLVYNYENVRVDNKTLGAFINTTAPQANQTSQTIRCPSIPEKLFIFVKPTKGSLSANNPLSETVTNAYLFITNFALQWGNSGIKFSSYSAYDLYKMSVANGLKVSWYDWKYAGKCLLIVDTTKDICLEPSEVVGQSSTFMTYQVTVTVSAAPLAYVEQAVAITYDLSVMNIANGKCVVSQKDCQFILTAPNGEEVLATTSDPKEKNDANSLPTDKAGGGSLFGSAAKLLSRGLNLASKVKPEHLDMAKSALEQLNGGSVVGAGLHRKGHRRVY